MQLARKLRFQIRDIRLDTDIERKEMKEKSLRIFNRSINTCHLISPPFLPLNKSFVLTKQPAQLEKIILQYLKRNQREAF